jgi:ABC-type multidrug transport system ATPase subunit/CRP-like cAMP-binding protein
LEEKTVSVDESTRQIVEILARSRVSQHLPAEVLAAIARRFRPLDVPGGTVLCRQGEPGDELYAVERGTLLTGQPRSATVRALEDARVWVLDAADLRDIVRSHPDFGVDMAYTMSERLTEEEAGRSSTQGMHIPLAGEKDVIKIGRADSNDIVIADPQVARVHAVIQRIGAGHQIVDLNSPTGTYVNGERIQAQALRDGDEIWIASHPIHFDRGALTAYARPGGIRVDALDLTRLVGSGDVTLHDVSLSIYPGELVCIVGASGAGKTTLLNGLSGLQPATSGRVLYNGIDYYTYFDLFRRSLGYVPQDDIVHPELTVEQTLYYAARLRLPDDTNREEIGERISDVLATLELTDCRGLEVRSLSGGQRKRVSIGVELLTQPGIFYLDEPTSGLDPGLDARMMDLFRKLADGGRTVVLTTHNLATGLRLGTRAAVLDRGRLVHEQAVGSSSDAESLSSLVYRLATP